MTDDAEQQERRVFGWALPGSLAVHAAAAALLIFGFPDLMAQPQKEEAIQVSLVPPPPEPAPEPEKAEPPPPPPEPAKVEPPPPEPEKPEPEEAKVEPPPPPPQPEEPTPEPPPEVSIPVLNPVLQFGDKDTGSLDSSDNNSAEDGASAEQSDPNKELPAEPPADTAAEPEEQTPPETAEPQTSQQSDVADSKEDPAPAEPEPEKLPAAEPPPDMAEEPIQEARLPETEEAPGPAPTALPPLEPQQGDAGRIAEMPAEPLVEGVPEEPATGPALPEQVALLPTPRPVAPERQKPIAEAGRKKAAASSTDAEVRQALKPRSLEDIVASLQSGGGSSSASSTTDMRNLSRGERAGQLCATQLQRRLQNSSFRPNYVPKKNLSSGNIVNVDDAFSSGGDWYNVSYRCGVDAGATRVVSFEFKIGGLVPRSEWARRRFPPM